MRQTIVSLINCRLLSQSRCLLYYQIRCLLYCQIRSISIVFEMNWQPWKRSFVKRTTLFCRCKGKMWSKRNTTTIFRPNLRHQETVNLLQKPNFAKREDCVLSWNIPICIGDMSDFKRNTRTLGLASGYFKICLYSYKYKMKRKRKGSIKSTPAELKGKGNKWYVTCSLQMTLSSRCWMKLKGTMHQLRSQKQGQKPDSSRILLSNVHTNWLVNVRYQQADAVK